jgi:tRNA1Val (adenine37-N6)-methyltransferase
VRNEERGTRSEETIDELQAYSLRIVQPRHGYRFSLDPLLLCDFAGIREGERVIDLGTGCGVIPLILARKVRDTLVTGVEMQEAMAELAARNVALNGMSDMVSILLEDVTSLKSRFPASTFDLVVSNPPFRKRGTGRISPKPGRDNARHESTAALADFLATSKYLVKPSGRICFIYHPSRLVEFLAEAAALKLAPVRLRMVHGNTAAEARMFLAELVKGRKGELKVMPPLIVYGDDGAYTTEMERIFGADSLYGRSVLRPDQGKGNVRS